MSSFDFYLVRHGKAEARSPGGDAARRLTAEGRAELAAQLRSLGPRLAASRIAASPLLRARETAELFSAATGAPVGVEDALAPGASGGRQLLELGRRMGAGAALVGHNPEIAEAVSLAAGRSVEVKAGTVAAIACEGDVFRLAWLSPGG